MFRLRRAHEMTFGLSTSRLFDDQTFYPAFISDLQRCREQVVIESPFIGTVRIKSLLPIIRKLRQRGVRVVINTRHPQEHDAPYNFQASIAIVKLQNLGVEVLYTGGHHRKLAIIDSKVLWEGSLNILSQNDSCEIMRRIESEDMAREMLAFTKLNKFIG